MTNCIAGTLVQTADMTKNKIKGNKGLNYLKQNWDQCAVHILYSKISTDPDLLKIRHSHRLVIQFLTSFDENDPVEPECNIAYIVNFLCFLPLEFSSLMTDGRDVF